LELRPRSLDKVAQLIDKGVSIPDPLSVDVGPDVDVARISGDGVTIYPGCRIYGAKTMISRGASLGAEAPVTLRDCRLGPEVELGGGFYAGSVLLDGVVMGASAHVREGCLLEERARGAHAVGLKQTILFPFVTLGSLVNFCDCLMAGGTSPSHHSEVGSSYVHFNFTPAGDKSTASLFGDVPRGVMLDQEPIFLGGQGGAVGPLRVAFGTVVAAGSILREDVLEEGQLVVASVPRGMKRAFSPRAYTDVRPVVRNNIVYLANLAALERWYSEVRRGFFHREELGDLMLEAALEVLAAAKRERVHRLLSMLDKAAASDGSKPRPSGKMRALAALFTDGTEGDDAPNPPRSLTAAVAAAWSDGGERHYLDWMRALPSATRRAGTDWLQTTVNFLCARAGELLDDPRLSA